MQGQELQLILWAYVVKFIMSNNIFYIFPPPLPKVIYYSPGRDKSLVWLKICPLQFNLNTPFQCESGDIYLPDLHCLI